MGDKINEQIIDARGKACPMPVVIAKKALDNGAVALKIMVDNKTATENLTRLGENSGFTALVEGTDGEYTVSLTAKPNGATFASPSPALPKQGSWVLFVGNEGIGGGSAELGASLMTMLFYTISAGENPPSSVIFMNGGVKLATLNAQICEHLSALTAQGCEVLVCGTCLNFYALTDKLTVGTVSNMYDILSRLCSADKVVSF